jgi:hypothetical protein
MSNQINRLDFRQNIQLAGLSQNNVPQAIYDISGGYPSILWLASVLTMENQMAFQTDGNPAKISTPFNSTDWKYYTTTMDAGYVIAQVAQRNAVTVNGVAGLQLIFTDNTYNAFRPSNVVMSGTNYAATKGFVVNAVPGQITIIPFEGAAFAGGDFAIGSNTKFLYNSGAVVGSRGVENLVQVPRQDFNYISTIRESWSWSMQNQYVNSQISQDGTWQNQGFTQTLRRFLAQIEVAGLTSNRSASTINGQEHTTMGGLDWAVRNRDGVYLGLTSQLTRATFERFLNDIRDRKAYTTSRRRMLYVGRAAYQRIAALYNDFVLQSGVLNTFGGEEVTGVNIKRVGIGGEEYDLVIGEWLNDGEFWPELSIVNPGTRIRSNDIYLLDLDPIPSATGVGSLPAIEMFHWAKNPNDPSTLPWYGGIIRGMTDAELNYSEAQSGNAQQVVTDFEGSSFQLMAKVGWNIASARFMGKIELLA